MIKGRNRLFSTVMSALIYANAVLAAEFAIKATPTDILNSAALNINVQPDLSMVGQPGALFVAAKLPNGAWFYPATNGWQPWNPGTPLPPYLTTTLQATNNFTLIQSTGSAQYAGATLYAGYGSNMAGMLQNGTYAPVYVIPAPAPDNNSLAVLPNDGRAIYEAAIAAARKEIRIEICVLEDPEILGYLNAAIGRGVRVRAIVDRGKYGLLQSEQANLQAYLTGAGGELHLSNPIFPRSFPKVILVDDWGVLVGSACLDQTTFQAYRDFVYFSYDVPDINDLRLLFENDWIYSAAPGQSPPVYNPTPRLTASNLIVSPVNASEKMVDLYRQARKTLDVYSELLGNPTLESELAAAVARGVKVRLISPVAVNGGDNATQNMQQTSLSQLKAAGVDVHVSGPAFSMNQPYMHARAAIVDGSAAYLGSISLSPDSITFNREAGLLLDEQTIVRQLAAQFENDFRSLTYAY